MKVVFITHQTALYGANRSLLNLIDGLVLLGVQPHVVVPYEGDISLALRERGVPVLVAPLQWWSSIVDPSDDVVRGKIGRYVRWRIGTILRLIGNLRIIPQVVSQLKVWDIDIIYTNSSVIPLGALVAWRMKKPHVWHLREFGAEDYQLTLDWGNTLTAYMLNKADTLICISESIRAHYVCGQSAEKFHVVYNGVATGAQMERLHAEGDVQIDSCAKYVFALVGLIHQAKGQEVAIKALGLLKTLPSEVRLIIAGGGDLGPLEELARECGVFDQILFCGYVENPYDIYLQADAVLMCSKHEAMGRVTVEAMAAARPVIGYNGGATAELILPEFNGLLYRGGERELANCMQRLVNNPLWAKEMGQNGWLIAREKYTTEVYAQNVYNVLTKLND